MALWLIPEEAQLRNEDCKFGSVMQVSKKPFKSHSLKKKSLFFSNVNMADGRHQLRKGIPDLNIINISIYKI